MLAQMSRNKYALITNINPKSPVSEAYRTLRTNITFSELEQKVKKILVTSPQAGEGRSTTIANLAVTYAQENKRVLLIDTDLRKPTLHQFFQKANFRGLTNILVNQIQAVDAIQETDIPNLHFLPSGNIPPNPSDLLASKRMRALIEQLETEYDLILLDSPPALDLTDAQILSTMCDGVLLLINHGKVKRQIAQKTLLNLEHVKARVLGVVINNVKH
jgi:capsular exopolysaccharide synthesis family protein